MQCEAGQYCTFLVLPGGALYAMGKGSYGRLGLGDSTNQVVPQRVRFGEAPDIVQIKYVSIPLVILTIAGMRTGGGAHLEVDLRVSGI